MKEVNHKKIIYSLIFILSYLAVSEVQAQETYRIGAAFALSGSIATYIREGAVMFKQA